MSDEEKPDRIGTTSITPEELEALLAKASKGPFNFEPDCSVKPSWECTRILSWPDVDDFRRRHPESSARPPYVATVYSYDNAKLLTVALNLLPHALAEHRELRSLRHEYQLQSEEVGRLRGQVAALEEHIRQRKNQLSQISALATLSPPKK